MAPHKRDMETAAADLSLEELAAPSPRLLDDPLEYLYADHFRQRCVCRALRRLASEQALSYELAAPIAEFLLKDLPLHHRDEEEDLFPVLRMRSPAEEGLGPILAELSQEHVSGEAKARKIAEALTALRPDKLPRLSRRTAEIAGEYASAEQRHLAIENGIVMVIARKRLRAGDLEAVARAMKARRGA